MSVATESSSKPSSSEEFKLDMVRQIIQHWSSLLIPLSVCYIFSSVFGWEAGAHKVRSHRWQHTYSPCQPWQHTKRSKLNSVSIKFCCSWPISSVVSPQGWTATGEIDLIKTHFLKIKHTTLLISVTVLTSTQFSSSSNSVDIKNIQKVCFTVSINPNIPSQYIMMHFFCMVVLHAKQLLWSKHPGQGAHSLGTTVQCAMGGQRGSAEKAQRWFWKQTEAT